jgi:hypothetical protein
MKRVHEVRGVLADMHRSETHPKSIEVPASDDPRLAKAMHLAHRAILAAGKRADKGYARKTPAWPIPEESGVRVLGYGAEKIAYKISPIQGDQQVLSIYHRESMLKPPLDVVTKKQERYATYRRYFGELIVPSQFMVVDNPWGEGSKPAIMQPYIKNMQELELTNTEQMRSRAENDKVFAQSLGSLALGYKAMTNDGLYPDFAESNVMVADSQITIVDTGMMYTADRAQHLYELHPNYRALDELASEHTA